MGIIQSLNPQRYLWMIDNDDNDKWGNVIFVTFVNSPWTKYKEKYVYTNDFFVVCVNGQWTTFFVNNQVLSLSSVSTVIIYVGERQLYIWFCHCRLCQWSMNKVGRETMMTSSSLSMVIGQCKICIPILSLSSLSIVIQIGNMFLCHCGLCQWSMDKVPINKHVLSL